jgi:Right handed beta helix region
MFQLVVVALCCIGLASCKEINPSYCLNARADAPFCPDPGTSGPCTSSAQCGTAAFPACELTGANAGMCVACTATDKDLCTGRTPRCEANECVACVDDGDCGDRGVCLPAGDCAAPERIIHVRNGGSSTGGCGASGNECSLIQAFGEVSSTRDVIRLERPATYTGSGIDVNVDNGESVSIAARGTIVRREGTGYAVLVQGDYNVTFIGGTIEGAAGGGSDGIRCGSATLTIHETRIQNNEESAIEAAECTLTVTGAEIRGNGRKVSTTIYPGLSVDGGSLVLSRSTIQANADVGVDIRGNARFVVIGNAIIGNGNVTDPTGGIAIEAMFDARNRLEFNTIAANDALISATAGLLCLSDTFTARNNIIWGNGPGNNLGGSCQHAYSSIGPGVLVPGMGNLNADPMLTDLSSDHHLQAANPVKEAADPQADLTGPAARDIDGDPRTAPADIGADQTK